MALLPETFYLSTRRISVAYDVKKNMQEHFVLLCNSTDVGEDTD